MLYALLIYQSEEVIEAMSEPEMQEVLAAHGRFQEKAKADGAFVMANKLMPSAAATSLRAKGGDMELMDGPFAESKEMFVGFYVVDCADLDRALDYARMIPCPAPGGVEVRPIDFCEAIAPKDAAA